MTKQGVIQEAVKNAYGKYYEEYRNFINPYSYCLTLSFNISDEMIKNLELIKISDFEWIPKSLQGIENNNGWTKIESEDEYPKIGDYDMSSFKLFYFTNNGQYEASDYKKWKLHYDHLEATHYRLQPIEKPKPPIY